MAEYEGGSFGVDEEEGKGTVGILGDLSEEVEREVRRRVGPALKGAKNGFESYREDTSEFFPFVR